MKNSLANLHPQVNVWLHYAPFYHEHLASQYYRKSYCKYYVDAALRFWKWRSSFFPTATKAAITKSKSNSKPNAIEIT